MKVGPALLLAAGLLTLGGCRSGETEKREIFLQREILSEDERERYQVIGYRRIQDGQVEGSYLEVTLYDSDRNRIYPEEKFRIMFTQEINLTTDDWNRDGKADLLLSFYYNGDFNRTQNVCICQKEQDGLQILELPEGDLVYSEENQRLYTQVETEEAEQRFEAYRVSGYDCVWEKTLEISRRNGITIYTVRAKRFGEREMSFLNHLSREEEEYWKVVIQDEESTDCGR